MGSPILAIVPVVIKALINLIRRKSGSVPGGTQKWEIAYPFVNSRDSCFM